MHFPSDTTSLVSCEERVFQPGRHKRIFFFWLPLNRTKKLFLLLMLEVPPHPKSGDQEILWCHAGPGQGTRS